MFIPPLTSLRGTVTCQIADQHYELIYAYSGRELLLFVIVLTLSKVLKLDDQTKLVKKANHATKNVKDVCSALKLYANTNLFDGQTFS